MTLPEAIAEAARLMRSAVPDNETVELLTAMGVTRAIAQEIIAFLPLVYGREVLRRGGCTKMSDSYERRLANGSISSPTPLARKPVWRECEAYLRLDLLAGSRGDDILMIAGCSAEIQAANKLLDNGGDIADFAFTSPLLLWPEEGPIDPER